METKKYYEGFAPVGDNWSKVFKLGFFNKRTWQISYVINNELKWNNIKVFSLEKKKSKANFNLGHNSERFADNKCFRVLVEHYPELLDAIKDFWSKKHEKKDD